MKKVVFLLVVVLLVGFRAVVFGQKGMPCAIIKQDRTIVEVRQILLSDGPYYDNLRSAYAEAINHNVGKNIITPDKEGMIHFLDNAKLVDSSFVNPEEYKNGVKYGYKVEFTNLTGSKSESWICTTYEGYDYVCGKASCMNPQKKKKVEVKKEAFNPKPESKPEPEPYIPPKEPKVEVEKETVIKEKETTVIIIQQQQPQVIQQMVPVSMPMMQGYGGSNFGMRIRIFAGSDRNYYPQQQQCYPQQRTYRQGYQRSYRQPVNRGTMSGGRGGYTQNHGTMSGGRGTMSGGGSGGAGGGRAY